MAKGTFGERLKRERELREVSREEVAAATRISERFLTALENEDWDRLPGGIFGRGFVRTIARYLGLNEENLLAEYDLARGDQLPSSPAKPEERIPSPPKWIPVAVVVALLLLLAGLVVAGFYAWRKYVTRHTSRQSSSENASPAYQHPFPSFTLTPVAIKSSGGSHAHDIPASAALSVQVARGPTPDFSTSRSSRPREPTISLREFD
jgi:cytoskeleton protein RodZ